MKNTTTTKPTTLARDEYGALYARTNPYAPEENTSDADRAIYQSVVEIVARAAAAGKIPPAHDGIKRARKGFYGTAVHHEIYDISPNGKSILVCVRSAEGGRYGVRTTNKIYYLITVCGKGVKVALVNKAIAAKAAKACGATIGGAIQVVRGKTKLTLSCLKPRTRYKMVRRNCDGNLVSVWDGSPWRIGEARVEAATYDHSGGFYCYKTPEEAIEAAANKSIFGSAREHSNLVLLECEVSGREFVLDDGHKRCVTRIKPVREFFVML